MVEDLLESVVKELEDRNYERVVVMLEEIVKKEPSNVKTLENLVRAYYGIGKFRAAIDVARTIERLYPICEEGYDLEALSIRQLSGDIEDVISIYKRGFDESPKSARLAYKLGKAYPRIRGF